MPNTNWIGMNPASNWQYSSWPSLLVEKLKGQGIHILEQTVVSGGRRVCFFEGPDGVQLEFIEMKK